MNYGKLNVALIGGIDRLKKHYMMEAERSGIELKVFLQSEVNIGQKILNSDAVVIFTNKITHKAKREVVNVTRSRSIRTLMCHSCGLCSFRDCINCLKKDKRV